MYECITVQIFTLFDPQNTKYTYNQLVKFQILRPISLSEGKIFQIILSFSILHAA